MAANFASGFAQGIARAIERKQDRSLIEEFKKAQKKLIDAQIDSATTQAEMAKRQLSAQQQFGEMTQEKRPEDGVGPVRPAISLIDVLTNPEKNPSITNLAIQAGYANPQKLVEQKQYADMLKQFLPVG